MARSFSQTLIRVSSSSPAAFHPETTTTKLLVAPTLKPIPHAYRLLSHRNQSSHSDYFQAVDLSHIESPSSDTELIEALAVQKIEDAIHRIVVRRSAPDWLPFLPGSSYWVPPRRNSYGIAQIVHKLANSLTEEEVMSLTTVRGWPSSAFYLPGPSSKPNEVETSSTQLTQAEDEEG